MPTATLQISKSPSPLNPAAQVHRREGCIYIPRRQWYSHLLLKQAEKRSCIKGLTFHSDCTSIHILLNHPSNKENVQLCCTLNARDYFPTSGVKHVIFSTPDL